MIKRDNIFYFEKFLQFSELVHGFSTRTFGSMREMGMTEPLKRFGSSLFGKTPPSLPLSGEEFPNIVRMHQVHSANVAWVTDNKKNSLETTDGVLTAEKDLFLSVITADCVPILLYDPVKNVVGAVHVGWRGAYKEIVKETMEKLQEKGSDPADIIVGIGPSIGSCCYDIAEEHADMFRSKFPDWGDILIQRDEKVFLNLPKLVQYQLQSMGIPATNMEDAGICTFESEELYSCRRDGENFSEFIGIIGKIKD